MRGLSRGQQIVPYIPYVLVCGILVAVPQVLTSYLMGLVIVVLIYAIAAMAFDLLLGYTGMLSFGHVVGWGIGSYTVGILVGKGITENFWIVLGVAILVALIVSAVFGFLALRTSGIYFTLITLALAQLLYVLTLKWVNLTGGENGLTGITRPWSLGDVSYYYLVLVAFIICFLLMRWLINSWFGKVLIGIRENEPRMLMLGYRTWAFKYLIYIITGVFAAIGGLLICFYNGIAVPDHFGFAVSGNFLLMVFIGGRGTLFGSLIGSIIVVFAINYLSAYIDMWMLVLGIIFVLVVMLGRKGIGGYLLEWWQKIRLVPTKQ